MSGKSIFFLLALIAAQILIGCGGSTQNGPNSNAVNQPANAAAAEPEKDGVKYNVEELGSLVKMPFEPEDLAWKEFNTNQQNRRLLAVFQLTPADAKKMLESASKIRPGKPVVLTTEKWFPTELVTQSEMSNDEGIQAMSYAADEFLQPPYNEGTLSRVDNTDFFVLELFAK